jgi:phenylalanyl-tRNA synthetase alpha subunit
MSSDGIGQLRSIEDQFDRECGAVADLRALEDIRNRYLSRKSGLLTTQLQNLRNIPAAERAAFGQAANAIKQKIDLRA